MVEIPAPEILKPDAASEPAAECLEGRDCVLGGRCLPPGTDTMYTNQSSGSGWHHQTKNSYGRIIK